MSQAFDLRVAKRQLSRLIELTCAGEEVTISKAGRPVARLVPWNKATVRRRIGFLKGHGTVPSAETFNRLGEEEILSRFSGRP